MEEQLRESAEAEGLTKSEFIRSLITERLEQQRLKESTPWELGKSVFGQHGSGDGRLSQDRKQLLKKKIRAKSRRH